MNLETDEKLLNKTIARNVGSEKELYVRGTPLFLKSMILKYIHYSRGPRQYSGVLTNLGKVTLPSEISEFVDYLIFTPPPPSKRIKVSCGIIGFNENLVLSFGNITQVKELEEKFIKFLASEGINSKLTTYSK